MKLPMRVYSSPTAASPAWHQGAGPNLVPGIARAGQKRWTVFGLERAEPGSQNLEQFCSRTPFSQRDRNNQFRFAPQRHRKMPADGQLRPRPKSGLDDDGSIIRAGDGRIWRLLPRTICPSKFVVKSSQGQQLFALANCISCHTPVLSSRAWARLRCIRICCCTTWEPALNDGIVQGGATSADWRTTPAVGSSFTQPRFFCTMAGPRHLPKPFLAA